MKTLVGKRVEVIATGERGNCTDFENGVLWVHFDTYPDVLGYLPGELREYTTRRRLLRLLREWLP